MFAWLRTSSYKNCVIVDMCNVRFQTTLLRLAVYYTCFKNGLDSHTVRETNHLALLVEYKGGRVLYGGTLAMILIILAWMFFHTLRHTSIMIVLMRGAVRWLQVYWSSFLSALLSALWLAASPLFSLTDTFVGKRANCAVIGRFLRWTVE